jgi:two-component system LytT family sensor kinase
MVDRGDDALHDERLDRGVHAPDRAADRLLGLEFSTNLSFHSANDRSANVFSEESELSDDMELPPRTFLARRLPDLGLALKSILAFWLLYMVLVTLRSLALMLPDFWDSMARRSAAATIGVAITFLIYLAMRPLAAATLTKKASVAGILCLPGSIVFASFNYFVFYILKPMPEDKMDKMWRGMSQLEMAVRSVAEMSLSWYFLFAAWAALYVAMSYATQLRASDRRAAAFAREAQEAQLRALRYQINPHFLFNTLNSLSSLILSQRTDVAERMIMNLSTFFRTTLSADPTADISLDEEIKLQRLYLDIEQVRFPERLNVEIDIPETLGSARVPILILQPIVENAIKYGVARSRRPVTLRISAVEEAGRSHISSSARSTSPLISSAASGLFPREFVDDWIHVGADEAMHFALLDRRLRALGSFYGDLPAHDGLWEAAEATAGDVLGRIAVVPMVLEARGLDVTPETVARFEAVGDRRSAAILSRIYRDEIRHVGAGTKWFKKACESRRLAAVPEWKRLIKTYFRGSLKPPFNDSARGEAGLSRDFYEGVALARDV